ncbi:MAG: PH domain-containing protein [Pseudonocardia sp.]
MLAPREIDEYLLPSERRVIRVRQHWAVMLRDIVETALFLILLIIAQAYLSGGNSVFIDNLVFYLGLIALFRLTIRVIMWWVERIVITNKRVMISKGVLTHNVGMMPLGKVTDLTFRRTFMGRILNYGTMIVESAGQIQALNKVRYMPRPEEIYEALSELIFGEKGRTRASGMLAKTSWRRRF